MKLELQREKQANDFAVSMEEIKTKLTDLELKYGANVPGSVV
jgi:hypothetical protein